jgi:osmotically-inducible protein OsmY
MKYSLRSLTIVGILLVGCFLPVMIGLGVVLTNRISLPESDPSSSESELVNDQEIAKVIVKKLNAEKKAGNLKGFLIDLNVEKGTVWLSGRVSSEEQRTIILNFASRVQGVKLVINDLRVEKLEGE